MSLIIAFTLKAEYSLTARVIDGGCIVFSHETWTPLLPFAAQCQAAWAGRWVEAVFSNALRAIRRTCSTSRSTRSRSPIRTRTARPRPRTRSPIAASRLTAAPPRRRADNPPDQVEHPTSRRPRPRPVSSRERIVVRVAAHDDAE